jgi:DNA-binding MarR family transcriptional regulator
VLATDDPYDRRRRAVALTEQGRAVANVAVEIAAEISAATLAPLSADERQQIVELLKKLG